MASAVQVIGGGLAGSEAAWQIAEAGFSVVLTEMRPTRPTKAHKTGSLAELVCSNSFRGAALTNAVGLLKEELRVLNSLMMRCADQAKVPAGGALAVDRDLFSALVDKAIRTHPRIQVVEREVTEIPESSPNSPVVIATGPLTSRALAEKIEALVGSTNLSFFDAISPIILGDSINLEKVFRQSRYDKGGTDDYLNIPLSKEAYFAFVDEVARGEKFGTHEEVESDKVDALRPFEGCMPIEEMVARGPNTLAFGPMKPMGLVDPATGRRPYAVVQLRQDNKEGTLWSMVGFQTRLRHPEQLRIFRMLPGLEEAEFVRLGTVHRNTFMDSPRCLDATLQFRGQPGLFFAGQITGVEGYVESTAGGIAAGINVARGLQGLPCITFPSTTAIGGLLNYISDPARTQFQPMNISFGLISGYCEAVEGVPKKQRKSKDDRRLECSEAALASIREIGRGLSGTNSSVELAAAP